MLDTNMQVLLGRPAVASGQRERRSGSMRGDSFHEMSRIGIASDKAPSGVPMTPNSDVTQ